MWTLMAIAAEYMWPLSQPNMSAEPNTPSPWLMTSADLPLTLIKELQNNPCAKQMMCSSRTIELIPVVAQSASCHPVIAVACKEPITSAWHYVKMRCVWLQLWQHDLKRLFASFFPGPVGLAATIKTTLTGNGMGCLAKPHKHFSL